MVTSEFLANISIMGKLIHQIHHFWISGAQENYCISQGPENIPRSITEILENSGTAESD